jgi:hypothetical protein
MSLYRRLLAERFEQLHPVLQGFHGSGREARGAGAFRVLRPPDRLRNAVAGLLGLPPAGDHVPLRLEVCPEGPAERWVRSFGGHRFVTLQSAWNGLLLEATGPACLGFALAVEGGGLAFASRRAWLFGIPLPRCCAPAVAAVSVPQGPGWRVQVRVRVPLLGELVRYEGSVVPE